MMKILHGKNKTRFVTEEREGHRKDNLICTILDPRFKLMNFNGCTAEMKADAESYLRENFMAEWSENRHQVDARSGQVTEVTVPDAAIVPDIFKNCKKKVILFTCIYNDTITLPSLSDSI